MTIKLANQSKAKLIDQERTYLNTLEIALFVNNHTPADTDTEGDYTEATCAGYVAQSPVFAAATLNGSNEGELAAPALTFLLTNAAGNFTVYGWYAIDPNLADKLVMAERDPAPFLVDRANAVYVVYPRKVMTTKP